MSDVRFIFIIYKTCVYMYTIPSFAQCGFVLEAYKLNSWLGLSEKIVALNSLLLSYCCLMMVNWLGYTSYMLACIVY